MDHSGKVAIVTGASKGIGRAIAVTFAAEGARVICHTHSRETELREWLKSREWSGRAAIFQADLREPLHQQNPGRIEETIDVNLTGAIRTAQAFLRSLERHGGDGASLLFIASTAASFGEAGWADYAAAKGGLWGLVQSLKNEIVRLDPRAVTDR